MDTQEVSYKIYIFFTFSFSSFILFSHAHLRNKRENEKKEMITFSYLHGWSMRKQENNFFSLFYAPSEKNV